MDTRRPPNLVLPAALFGVALVATALILHHGLTSAADRLGNAVDRHSSSLSRTVDKHAESVTGAADALGHVAKEVSRHADVVSNPSVRITAPVPVEQPVIIRGPRPDGALPVDAGIGK